MTDEIKIPDINPPPPPEIEEEWRTIVEYIHLGDDVRKFKETLQKSCEVFLYVPIVGWVLYGAAWVVLEVVLGIIAFLGDCIDAIWNSIADIINDLYIWFINFRKSVEKKYNGNWAKAIIDMVIKVALLYALDEALNIPAIKQLWDTLVNVVKKINDFLKSVRDFIDAKIYSIQTFVNKLFKDLDPLVRYIFKEEIEFWHGQITSLISTVRSELLSAIDRIDKALTSKLEFIISEVNNLLKEIGELKSSIESRVQRAIIQTVARLVVATIEEDLWLKRTDKEVTVHRSVAYSMPGQVESTYKMTVTFNDVLFSPEIFYRVLANEVFTEGSELCNAIFNAMNTANEELNAILYGKERWLSTNEAVSILLKEEKEAREIIKKQGLE